MRRVCSEAPELSITHACAPHAIGVCGSAPFVQATHQFKTCYPETEGTGPLTFKTPALRPTRTSPLADELIQRAAPLLPLLLVLQCSAGFLMNSRTTVAPAEVRLLGGVRQGRGRTRPYQTSNARPSRTWWRRAVPSECPRSRTSPAATPLRKS